MECHTFHCLLMLYNDCRPNIKLIKLPICYCNTILLDMHSTDYTAIITLWENTSYTGFFLACFDDQYSVVFPMPKSMFSSQFE